MLRKSAELHRIAREQLRIADLHKDPGRPVKATAGELRRALEAAYQAGRMRERHRHLLD